MNPDTDTPKACPHCGRPYPTKAPPRSRAGDHPGVEREAERALGDPTAACKRALEVLWDGWAGRPDYTGGWVSANELRARCGGDAPRRVRQLRDEYGYRIEVELRTDPTRQAWYRLMSPHPINTEVPSHV